MPTVYSHPTPSQSLEAWQTRGGGPPHHQVAKAKYLAQNGWQTVEEWTEADIVHAHGVTNLTAHVLTIHAIWPTHVYTEHPPFWDEHNEIMAKAMQGAGRVIALSDYTADLCRELSGAEVDVVPQAIDPDEWHNAPTDDVKAAIGIPANMPLVVVGKGSADDLRDPAPAVALAAANPDIAVAITADRDAVIAYAGPITENVFAVGRLAFRKMQMLLHACDVFLATTLEASGQGHLEAMYLGKPILGYAWGGVGETVPTGRYGAGELVEPGNTEALVEALDVVLRRRKGYGKKAASVAQSYTWPAVIEQLIEIYEEVR